MTAATPAHPSKLALERYLLDELSDIDRASLVGHAAACASCGQRLTELRADNERFAQDDELPEKLDQLAAALDDRAPSAVGARPPLHRRPWFGAAVTGAGLALAAALAISLWPAPPKAPDFAAILDDGRATSRPAVLLEVIGRAPDGAPRWLAPGDAVHPGDALRFRVRSPVAGYLAVLGLDPAQKVRVHAPAAPALRPIAAGQPVLVDDSIVLDATLGAALLVAIVCPTPRTAAEVEAAARRALLAAGGSPRAVERITGPAALGNCHEAMLLVDKVAP
jgi:hypothetical protein